MTNDPGFAEADELQSLITKRTGIASKDLKCPREKSDMTPCIARDGHLAVTYSYGTHAICVGCEHGVLTLLAKEKEKHDQ